MTLLFSVMVWNEKIYEGWLVLGLIFDLLLILAVVGVMKA